MNGPYMCHEKKLESKQIRFYKNTMLVLHEILINLTFSFIFLDIISFKLLYIFSLSFTIMNSSTSFIRLQ